MTRILEKRDAHYDLCRTFMVVSMIFTHSFQRFLLGGYNPHTTVFVTIGFVFLAGFTVAAIKDRQMSGKWYENSIGRLQRGIKLITIFIICNLVAYLTFGSKQNNIAKLEISDVLKSIITGKYELWTSVPVLVPIGLTMILAVLFLHYFRTQKIRLIILLILFITHLLSDQFGYTLSLTIIGCIGIVLGSLASDLDWDHITNKIIKHLWVFAVSYALLAIYLFSNGFISEKIYPFFSYHFAPTVFLLCFVYFSSIKFRFDRIGLLRFLNQTLGNNLLFAYLYHILILVLLMRLGLVKHSGCTITETVLLAVLLSVFTAFSCFTLNYLNAKSSLVRKTYNLIFK